MKLKVLLTTLVVCLVTLTTKAQIGKGSLWLGGGIGFSSSKGNNTTGPDSKDQLISINPGIGIAVKDNTVAGGDVTFSHRKQEYDRTISSTVRTTNTYGLGIFIRQYVPVVNRLYIFGQGRAGFTHTTATDEIAGVKSKAKSWSTGLTFNPGVSFAVNNKLHLETGFNNLFYVQYSSVKSASGDKSSAFGAGVSLENNSSFYLGVRILLNKKG